MRLSVLWIALVLCVIGQPRAFAQGPAKTATTAKKGEAKTLITKDNWNIAINYFASTREKDAAVVVLIPGKNDNQAMWAAFASELNSVHDMAVITVDLRKQPKGKTTPPQNPLPAAKNPMVSKVDVEAMILLDLEAVKRFIYDEHQEKKLNMRRMGLVAGDVGTAIAVQYAAYDWAKVPHDDGPSLQTRTPRGQDIQALVLLSPTDTLPGTNISKELPLLRTAAVACMQVYSSKAKKDVEAADKIYQGLGGNKTDKNDKPKEGEAPKPSKLALVPLDLTAAKGVDLLGKPVVIGNQAAPINAIIGNFLAKHLKEPDIEWRDRKSKLN